MVAILKHVILVSVLNHMPVYLTLFSFVEQRPSRVWLSWHRCTISRLVMSNTITPSCPNLVLEGNCSTELKKLSFGKVPPALNLVSSCFALLGALIVILSYVCFRDFQTGSRKVIMFLSWANLFQALGCASSSLLYLVYVDLDGSDEGWCSLFDTLCQLLAYVTWWATLASFIWTCILALYL